MDGTVLVADDDRTIRTVLTQALTRAGCKVHATASLVTLMRWVDEGKGDLVISDVMMPDGNGLESLPEIHAKRPGLPVIVISAQNTIMTAIRAESADAFDYLPKPFDLPDLMKRSARALDQKRVVNAKVAPVAPSLCQQPPSSAPDLPLVGRTPRMQDLYRLIARVMNADLSVFIQGESGTGKSLVARAIHDFSDRRNLPFVIASASDLEGADAIHSQISSAQGGSFVIDEISDLSADAQARLARLLDGMGQNAPRIVATSQCDLADMTATGAFRTDLYYRINGVSLSVPALRDRVDDIPLLAQHFLLRLDRNQNARTLRDDAMEVLRTYAWPGNVRQLENVMGRLLITTTNEEISAQDVSLILGASTLSTRTVSGVGSGANDLSSSVAEHLQRYFDLHGGALPPEGLYGRVLKQIEAPLLEIALDATNGNQARCADLLGINRNTLRKKITDLEISVTRRRKLT